MKKYLKAIFVSFYLFLLLVREMREINQEGWGRGAVIHHGLGDRAGLVHYRHKNNTEARRLKLGEKNERGNGPISVFT